jgi:uncharacterized protein
MDATIATNTATPTARTTVLGRSAGTRRSAWRAARMHVRPPVTITDPPADMVVERDVAVPMRDGVRLRVNVFRPAGEGRFPVLLCAHPYGKDRLPRRRRFGAGYRMPFQYHVMLQGAPFTHSALTGWESPDPAHWVPRGYVVVNADLRGWGHSDGVGQLLSAQEGLDGHDLVEWAADQPWSTGRVGMNGVSYLALSQWATAAAQPPHLAAICPWEGFTDAYRDFGRPGGIRNDGFFRTWAFGQKVQRRTPMDLRREQKARPLRDAWWAERDRDLEAITTPALICGSFSDHDLHSRGSFDGFRRISAQHKWLYTHRGPKWATYYSPAALQAQEQFFDHFLRGVDTGLLDRPRVRVEVREDADTISAVHGVEDWPPPGTTWTSLHLDAATSALSVEPPAAAGSTVVGIRRGRAVFTHRFARDTEVVGPMSVRLHLELPKGGDVPLFVTVRKFRDGREVGFEGSYGFDGDSVTYGMLKASHRATDPERCLPGRPYHPHTRAEPLMPGQVVPVEVELLPSATLFRAGEELRLDVQGHWPFPRNPLTGPFPAHYRPGPRHAFVLHTGGAHDAVLTVPSPSSATSD